MTAGSKTPHSLEAEEALLGAALQKPWAMEIAAEAVAVNDLYRDEHRTIYRAMVALFRRGEPVEIVTVCHEMGDRLDHVGGPGFITGLIDTIPTTAGVAAYAKIVGDDSRRRRLLALADELTTRCQKGENPGELADLVLRTIDDTAAKRSSRPPAMTALTIKADELFAAHLTPRCIVHDYLFADVATLAAPGGTGKTTLVVYEIICIALGRPVHGLEVLTPGRSLFITAEDRREQLIARLREIMGAMSLTGQERQTVMDLVLIWDVSGEPMRLVEANDGNINLTALADNIVRAFAHDPPVLAIFDPVISFGASEGFVNDNEQGIITACRRIVRGLNCCVRLIAHTGKANAREGTLDQYSSRGGSALSDGARMVAVLQAWQPGNDRQPPAECTDLPGASITILARPKLSYAPANLPLLWIRRNGWTFETFVDVKFSREELGEIQASKVLRYLEYEVAAGHRHNKTSLESSIPDLARSIARSTVTRLMAQGKIIEADLPLAEQKTKRKTHLVTAAGFGRIPVNDQGNDADENAMNNAAAYRENNSGIIPPPIYPPFPNVAETFRRDSAGLAGLPQKEIVEVTI